MKPLAIRERPQLPGGLRERPQLPLPGGRLPRTFSTLMMDENVRHATYRPDGTYWIVHCVLMPMLELVEHMPSAPDTTVFMRPATFVGFVTRLASIPPADLESLLLESSLLTSVFAIAFVTPWMFSFRSAKLVFDDF